MKLLKLEEDRRKYGRTPVGTPSRAAAPPSTGDLLGDIRAAAGSVTRAAAMRASQSPSGGYVRIRVGGEDTVDSQTPSGGFVHKGFRGKEALWMLSQLFML